MPSRIDARTARALVTGSRLFDEDWYATQVGTAFPDRESAVQHWVEHAAAVVPRGVTPHPLFAPLWLWPRGAWARKAPDPLSCWLSQPDEQDRSPHPQIDLAATGALEEWLATHDPAEALPPTLPRLPEGDTVVLIEPAPLRRAVAWIRHFRRRPPDVPVQVVAEPAVTALLVAVAGDVPSVRVVAEADPRCRVVVTVDREVRPPHWSWLPELLAALDRPGTRAAQSLLLTPDFTVAAAGADYSSPEVRPLLAGLTADDAQRLVGHALPAAWPGAVARRSDLADGATVLAADSRLVVGELPAYASGQAPAGAAERSILAWRAAGFEPPGVPLRVREGLPAMRWSIDIAAGAAMTTWGDLYFARSLAAALERLGQWVVIDHPETRDRATRDLDDVALTLRGLHRVVPRPGRVDLLWVISHPELVSGEECAEYDQVFAASTAWAAQRSREWAVPVHPLLQCTDVERFRPGLANPDSGPSALFVGNSRHVMRPAVRAAINAGIPLDVYGEGWEEWLPAPTVRLVARHVDNAGLGGLYASAGVVLNDHWDDMREAGFISNRVFDVLACGARLVTDDVAGLRDALGVDIADSIGIFRSADDFVRLTTAPHTAVFPDLPTRTAIAQQIRSEHSFDARARTLLLAARTLRGNL